MASRITKFASGASAVAKEVVPVVSSSKQQARASVLAVYKELQRLAPTLWWDYGLHDMPLPVFRAALKKKFTDNAHLNDIRVIDRKVAECKQDMVSIRYFFYNEEHVRNYLFRENIEAKPTDFLSKFLSGNE